MGKPIFEDKMYSDGPVDQGPGEKSYTEGVWEFDDWKPKGPQLGTVDIKEKQKAPGKKEFEARFTFDDGTKIRVKGDLPGGETWVGRGSAEAEDEASGERKTITVEGRNPKGWG